MTPGWEASYVSKISAVLSGSLTPYEIRWELSVADGMRFVTCWWNHFFERAIGSTVFHGVECRRISQDDEESGETV